MRVMLTGGTGFIGSWVTEALASEGHEVTLLARDPRKVQGFLDRKDISFVQGSLTDSAAIRRAVDGQDACIHIALGWGDDARAMLREDTTPSIELFQSAIEAGAQHVVFTSSIAVFGDRRDAYTDDTAPRPNGYYGATKAAAESFLLAASAETGIRGNVIRPGYTFGGPVTEGATVYTDTKLLDMARAAIAGHPITVRQNDGTQFIWVGDLAKVYLAVLLGAENRKMFTAVSSNFTTWEQCARLIVERANSSSDVIAEPTDLLPTQGRNDVSAIRDSFGLEFDSTSAMREHVDFLLDRAAR